jgi:hypothetical protein
MLLVAIVKAFNLQKIAQDKGKDLLSGYAYYEFGLFKGFSFWFAEQISKDYAGENFSLYGFDSFEGLPQSKVDFDLEGNYAVSQEFVTSKLTEHGTDFKRAKLFKGFYSKEHFTLLRKKEKFFPVSIAVIDVDLYESCIEVLNFLKDYLVAGSIILFDDYNVFDRDDRHGERRAFLEFKKENPKFQAEHIFDFGWHGSAFRVASA